MSRLAELRDRHYWARARRREQRAIFREAVRTDKRNAKEDYGDPTAGWVVMVTTFSAPMGFALVPSFHPEFLGLTAIPLALGVGLMWHSDRLTYTLRVLAGKVGPHQRQIESKNPSVKASALSIESRESSH